MGDAFRRPRPGEIPTAGSQDELLTEFPAEEVGGGFEGYRRGRWARTVVFGSLIVGLIATGFAVRWYIGQLEARKNRVVPEYQVDPGDADQGSKVLYWSDGAGRLGLYRNGVQAIALPDRTLRLAPDCDHAQVNVVVRDNETIKLTVLTGEIRVIERDSK